MAEPTVKTISAEKFAALDFAAVTLLDLREPDEVLVGGIDGAINIPFSEFAHKLDDVPKGKPVYVFCRTGDWSEEVTEILTDRGYDAYNVEGGYKAYKEQLAERAEEEPVFIDAKGLKCPGPIVKVADTLRPFPVGQRVYIEATEDAFASDTVRLALNTCQSCGGSPYAWFEYIGDDTLQCQNCGLTFHTATVGTPRAAGCNPVTVNDFTVEGDTVTVPGSVLSSAKDLFKNWKAVD